MAIYLVTENIEIRKSLPNLFRAAFNIETIHTKNIKLLWDFLELRQKDNYLETVKLIIIDIAQETNLTDIVLSQRENKLLNNIPLLFLISNEVFSTGHTLIDKGWNEVIRVPWEEWELLLRIKNLLRLAEKKKDISILEQELESTLLKIEEVTKIITTDKYSGIPNRRRFEDFFSLEWGRCLRNNWPISLLTLQIDSFLNYENSFGPQNTQNCIKKVANEIQESAARPGDLLAMYDKTNFVVVLSETNLDGAIHVSKNILSRIKKLEMVLTSDENTIVSVSIGIASTIPIQVYRDIRRKKDNDTDLTPNLFIESSKNALKEAMLLGGGKYFHF